MRTLDWITIALISVSLLFGCSSATLRPEQCRDANWHEIGLVDGRLGLLPSHLVVHRHSCEKTGVQPDVIAYEQGRREGVQDFCTPGGGYDAGTRGHVYQGICADVGTPEARKEFLKQYRLGQEVFRLRREQTEAEEELSKKREQLSKDKSVAAEVAKVYHLVAGTSATASEEERLSRTRERLASDEARGAVSAVTFRARPDAAAIGREVAGAMVGTTLGFGAGHGIQGHYRNDGWKWTAIDALMFTGLGVIDHNCASGRRDSVSGSASPGDPPPSEGSRRGASCARVALPLWMASFIGLRIWQGYELFAHVGSAFSPYASAVQHARASPNVIVVTDIKGQPGLLAQWEW